MIKEKIRSIFDSVVVKLVALVALSLIFGMFMPISSCAKASLNEGYYDLSKSDREVVGRLEALDVMFGKSDGFDPDSYLTRAEATAIITRLNDISEMESENEKGYKSFDDVEKDKWYTGYINIARKKGLVEGIGKNKFAPDRNLSYQEMLAMLTRTLGCETLVKQTGKWPTNYINFGIDNMLVDGVDRNFAFNITRIETARLVSNALDAYLWEPQSASTFGEVYISETDRKLLSRKLDVQVYESYKKTNGNLKSKKNKNSYSNYSKKSYVIEKIDTKDRDMKISGIGSKKVADFVDMAGLYIGMEVDVWIDSKNKIIFIKSSSNANQDLTDFDEVKEVKDDEIKVKDGSKTKTYKYSKNMYVSINGEIIDDDESVDKLKKAFDSKEKKENSSIKVIIDEDDEITHIYVEQYDKAILVKDVDINNEKIEADKKMEGSEKADIKLKKKNYKIVDKNNVEIELSDIKKGDMILYFKGHDTLDYALKVLKPKKVTGKVKSTSNDYVKVDGEKYHVNILINSKSLIKKMRLKSEVTLYLDEDGNIVMYKGDTKSLDEYGVVTCARSIYDNYGKVGCEVKITSFDKTSFDGNIDIEKTESKDGFNAQIFETDKDMLDRQVYKSGENSLLSTVIRFDRDGDDIEIMEFSDLFYDREEGSDGLDLIRQLPDGYRLNADKEKLSKSGDITYKITSDTKIMMEKKKSKEYEIDVKEIELDDLKDGIINEGDVILADIDSNTHEVGLMYVKGEIQKDETKHFGIIKSIAETVENNIFDVELFFEEDNKKDVELDDSSIRSNLSRYKGALIRYSENNDKIYNPTIIMPTKDNLIRGQLYTIDESDKTMRVCNAGEEKVRYLDLSRNCVIIKCKKIEEFSNRYEIGKMQLENTVDVNFLDNENLFFGEDSNVTAQDAIYYYMIPSENNGAEDEVAAIFFIEKD